MSTRISPIERIRAEIDDLFGSQREMEEVARLGVRLLMQTAIEAEVTEFLGRERYSHGKRSRAGSRNGHCPTTIKTTAGPVKIDRPKLRGTDEAFASRLLGVGVCRTNVLESLVIAGFVRGLSVRDVEAGLANALGAEAALSKSTVSRVCEAIKDEFDTWKCRDLSDVALEYLFLDGSHFRMHDGARAEPVLAAWGITTDGRPVLVGLDTGASESTDAWKGFLDGMVARGLRPPLLVVSDDAPGLIGAVELVFPNSLRQRCAIHRARNILAKVPVEHQAEVKAAYWAIFDPTAEPPGERSIAVARARAADFSATSDRRFPSAVACLNDDLTSLFSYLRFTSGFRRFSYTHSDCFRTAIPVFSYTVVKGQCVVPGGGHEISPLNGTPATTRQESRSATNSSPRYPSSRETGTANGTTPSNLPTHSEPSDYCAGLP